MESVPPRRPRVPVIRRRGAANVVFFFPRPSRPLSRQLKTDVNKLVLVRGDSSVQANKWFTVEAFTST